MSTKTVLVANGKRLEFEPGTKMLEACTKLGLKVPLDCRKVPKLKSVQEKGLAVTVDNA
eukprot:gene42759-52247_t